MGREEQLLQLCEFCKGVADFMASGGWKWMKSFPHFTTFDALAASALKGCPLCLFALESVEEDAREGELNWNSMGEFGEWVQVRFGPRCITLEPFCHRDKVINTKNRIYGRDVFENPSDAISALVVPLIAECRATHESCRQIEDTLLPTRVIDVSSGRDWVYLRDSDGLTGSYTILTHSWGTMPTITTTSTTIDERMSGISHRDLPQTFRDAIQITRLLGIKYLWIDSLCIVQDQVMHSDWDIESAKMLEYYQNAYITIGALNSINSFSGFLNSRLLRTVKLAVEENLYVRESGVDYDEALENSTLESRAWCLQERLLSTRIVHFRRTEIFWECQTQNQRESSCEVSRHESFIHLVRSREMKRVLSCALRNKSSDNHILNVWYSIVESYSRRNLTRPGDILPAISGIATQIHGRSYYQNRPGVATGAPSWSWAGMTSEVHWPNMLIMRSVDTNPRLQLHDYQDFCGQEISLRSRCRNVRLSRRLYGEELYDDGLEISADNVKYYEHVAFVQDESGTKELAIAGLEGSPTGVLPKAYKAMEVLEAPWQDFLIGVRVYFLLLLSDNVAGRWRRVGVGMSLRHQDPWQTFVFDDCPYEDISLV